VAGKSKDLSRLFVYWNLREPYENLKGKDKGSYLRDGFKMVNKFGVPSEQYYKFKPENVNTKPGDEIYKLAKDNKAITYKRVNTIEDIKNELVQNNPITFSTAIGEMFYYLQGPLKDQKYKAVNKSSNKLVGYHAMLIVGYDDTLNSFIVENSWSDLWGDQGFCRIPYATFFADSMDAWVCTRFATDLLSTEPEEKEPEEKEDSINIFLKIWNWLLGIFKK